MLQVLLADNRPLLQAGMQAMLSKTDDLQLLESQCNQQNIYQLCRKHTPDVLILNLNLPDLSLKDLLYFLQSYCASIRLLYLLERNHNEIHNPHKLLQIMGGCNIHR